MAKGVFTVRIDPDKEEALDRLAKSADRSRNYLVSEAIAQYLDIHAWQIEQTKLALQEADAGDFATDEEVQAVKDRFTGSDEG